MTSQEFEKIQKLTIIIRRIFSSIAGREHKASYFNFIQLISNVEYNDETDAFDLDVEFTIHKSVSGKFSIDLIKTKGEFATYDVEDNIFLLIPKYLNDYKKFILEGIFTGT